MRKEISEDPILEHAITILKKTHKCHTIVLYGSHAKGDAAPTSDYDLVGINKGARKLRIAKKFSGRYLDLFVLPEKDLKKATEQYLHLSKGVLLFDKNRFGRNFLQKLSGVKLTKLPSDEIAARKVWAVKMLERAKRKDIEGNFRRTWLTMALLEDYFLIRGQRYFGSKESFRWLEINDKKTYALFEKTLRHPTSLKLLGQLVRRVIR